MHYKNTLKKAVVLALSLICTQGVAMKRPRISQPQPQPRSRTVDFKIMYTRPETNAPVMTAVDNVCIEEHQNMINYVINKGIKQGMALDPFLPRHHHVDEVELAGWAFVDLYSNEEFREMIFEKHNKNRTPRLYITLLPPERIS
jgi:hypothetical protein